MAKQTFIVTREGYDKFVKELENLKFVQRPDVKQKLKEARAQGDLSENAEYDAARDLQGRIEGRIRELEAILESAVVAEENSDDAISLGMTVKLHDITYDEDLEYTIVGPTEASPSSGKISNESPVGKALLGAHKGDKIEVETLDGMDAFEVLDFYR